MKHSTLRAALRAAFLSFLLSFGAVCCLVTAFSLEISMSFLLLCCGGCAVAGSLLFRLRHGGAIAACILALLGGYLWQQGAFIDQTLLLCNLITSIYDRAYGWGYLGNRFAADSVVLPLCILGSLLALADNWCITRRRYTLLAAILSLIPLGLCMVVTDTIPTTGSLFMLLLGLLLLLLTQYTSRYSEKEGIRLTWLLTVPVALALALLFLVIPRSSYNKQNQAEKITNTVMDALDSLPVVEISENGSLTLSFVRDIPSQVNLQSIGPNTQFSLRVMEVTAENSGKLYLRGRHYDTYTGTQWHNKVENRETFIAPYLFSDNGSFYGLEPKDMGNLSIRTFGTHSVKYLPYHPDAPRYLHGGKLDNLEGETKYSYRWYALPHDLESDAINMIADVYTLDSSSGQESAVQLPYHTSEWAVDYLWNNLFSKGLDDPSICAIANDIADLVRNSASYDLNTQRMPETEQDFARWFLEESDTGYCVHYATATTVLLRAAGIPARYVEGYMTDAVAGETVSVTDADAHAWVEYYINGIGWVPLESTAAAAADNEQDVPAWVPDVTGESTAPPQTTTLPQDGTDPSAGTAITMPPDNTQSVKKPLRIGAPILIAAAILLALFVQWPVRIFLRSVWLAAGSSNARGLKKWRYARRLARLLGRPLPDDLMELALRAKFSQHTLADADLVVFDTFCTAAAGELRQRPWWQQLYYRLFWAAY